MPRTLSTCWRAAALAGWVLLATGAAEARGPGAEIHLGGAWNLPAPLRVRQAGSDDLSFRAHWETRALEPPFYYVARLIATDGRRGWALDLVHHKVFLVDAPPEIGRFDISHGYNLLTVQRLFEDGSRRYGLGAGVVIAHPENEVRGRALAERGGTFGGGYHLAGPSVNGLLSWRPAGGGRLYPVAEVRASLSYARVPVAGGSARVPNAALHVTVGVGARHGH